jgi:isoamylase
VRSLLPLLTLTAAACASDDYARLYWTDDKAPSLSWEEIEAMDHMGPTLIDRGVNFCVYSENATRIDLLLFDDGDADLPTRQVPLVQQGDLWNLYVEGVGLGQLYGYVAWGPNWEFEEAWYPGSTDGFLADVDRYGNRFNPNKLLFDPWGKALHREYDWNGGSPASGPKGYEDNYGAAMKTVITRADAHDPSTVTGGYTWSTEDDAWMAARKAGEVYDWNELVLYEVHPKGLSASPSSGVDHPGTFRGVGEMAAYLQDLGVTSLELLPIHEKPLDGGYWGYNSFSFFAPELDYSAEFQATGDVDDMLDEVREMVDTLHQHEIEVVLDVVYNHTGEGGLWRERLYFETYDDAYEVNFDPKEVAGLYSYRGLDNAAWYALDENGQTYWNNTGVGNETRANHTPMYRLTMDSLHFWVEEMHVDGFRFDLAGILGEKDLDYNTAIDAAETILQDIVDDPILQEHNTRIIAEPWTAAGTGPGIGGFPISGNGEQGWMEWNPYFRDWWRSIINIDEWGLNSAEGLDGGAVMTGSQDVYGWNGRQPWHSINFVTVHDGFTMYDLLSYDTKQNGCGLLNPVCCDDPLSVWCDDDSGEDNNRSRDWGTSEEPFKRQQMRNLFVAMMVSHGTPMIYGGDEWMRTQYGNNNAYSTGADNEWNWFRWSEWSSVYNWHRYRMHDFVRNMTALRRDHSYAFAPSTYGGGMPFSWKNSSNVDMDDDDWAGRAVMIHYYDDGNFEQPELAVLINMERESVTFTLPTGREWERLVDTQQWYDMPGNLDEEDAGGWFSENPSVDPYLSQNIWTGAPEALTDATYTVSASSIVIVRER